MMTMTMRAPTLLFLPAVAVPGAAFEMPEFQMLLADLNAASTRANAVACP